MSYCDVPEFYCENLARAKKQHRCIECLTPIVKGERYMRCTMKFDGTVETLKQHLHCWHFARYINFYEPRTKVEPQDGCIEFGGIGEALSGIGDCEDLLQFWEGLVSGCAEVFEGGSGI